MTSFIYPNWMAPANVHAFTTTRKNGVSFGAYGNMNGTNGLNLALHVGDDESDVRRNRVILRNYLPNEPQWLNQTHSTKVWCDAYDYNAAPPEADAVVITEADQVGVIMTADCLPVLFASSNGKIIGAAHAGWRGLVSGVLEQTLAVMCEKGAQLPELHVWLGPAIGASVFEVGQDVVDRFQSNGFADVYSFFKPSATNKYLVDIYGLARLRLQSLGIRQITGGSYCTVTQAQDFYSYRRDKTTGRMATLIWMDAV